MKKFLIIRSFHGPIDDKIMTSSCLHCQVSNNNKLFHTNERNKLKKKTKERKNRTGDSQEQEFDSIYKFGPRSEFRMETAQT
jgi:hypothetical protein